MNFVDDKYIIILNSTPPVHMTRGDGFALRYLAWMLQVNIIYQINKLPLKSQLQCCSTDAHFFFLLMKHHLMLETPITLRILLSITGKMKKVISNN